MTIDVDLLARVSNAYGVSGFEDGIQEVVTKELASCCDEVSRDRLGNVIGVKRATGQTGDRVAPRIVLAAHADEIGLMVKHIAEGGFLRVAAIGGINAEAVTSQAVVVHGRDEVPGVVVPRTKQGEPTLTPDDLYIDLGLPESEVRRLVEVGDAISFTQNLWQLNPSVFCGRNFDDRIGIYCLIEAMRRAEPSHVDIYGVSTVQEEVGVRGMPVAAYAIEADIGVAIDGSICRSPDAPDHERTCDFGAGTGIYIMDRLTIGSPRLVAFLVELCQRHQIPFQRNVGGGTDASALQRSRLGSLATTVGAPVRYMHSTVQLCHTDDITATVALLVALAESANELLN